jgi:hypothetical protein
MPATKSTEGRYTIDLPSSTINDAYDEIVVRYMQKDYSTVQLASIIHLPVRLY